MNKEKDADKEFIKNTNDLHQKDMQDRYQKKKMVQAHLANFYQ